MEPESTAATDLHTDTSPTQPDPAELTAHKEAWFIPIAIVVAGFVLAAGIYIQRVRALPGTVEGDVTMVRPVSPADHIVGNPQAPVVLITYADIDSPFAKDFQATMQQLMTEYGPAQTVAWVYRHLPLIDQHIYAASHAEAAECAASISGPTMFWRFIDALNARAPGTQQFDPRDYESVVNALGILPATFNACMTDNRFEQRVADDFANGLAIGAGGSPFSVLLVAGKPPVTIDGAVPYADMKEALDDAIAAAEPALAP